MLEPQPELDVLPNGTTMTDFVEVMSALMRAARVSAENAAGSQISQEHTDYATASLRFVQALVALDPTRISGGNHPDAMKASMPDVPPTNDGDGDGQIGEKDAQG